ncbi:MAG: type II secretion system F family protein [Candidatus Omnitrophica bacterium]|nr:type II secretion system F family protein [Candidatus Omnitrophota bacterium]
MPLFEYTYIDSSGSSGRSTMEAPSQDELAVSLQRKGYTVTSVTEKAGTSRTRGPLKKKLKSKMKQEDLVLLARQLSTLLESGVTLLRSLNILLKQIDSKPLYLVLERIKADVEAGQSLRDAIAKHPKAFSKFWVNIVEAGETSGQLPSTLGQLAGYLEASGSFKRKIISALMYPIILATVAVGAILIFVMKIIPVFTNIFAGFDLELPPITKLVVALSDVLTKYFLIMVIAAGALVYGIRQYIKTEQGKWQFDTLMLKMPIVGSLVLNMSVERFSTGLGTLIKSGCPILLALDIVARAVGNRPIEKALDGIKISVRDGKSIAEPMERSGIFPPMVVQMVGVGEETGQLAKMLDKVSAYYTEVVNELVARLTAVFEPILLVFMGSVIGFLVVAMFLPIFKLTTIGGK